MLDSMMAIIFIMVSVAFFTLMERKIMGISHYRKGPSKIVMSGLSQPMADAVKLMVKEYPKIYSSKMFLYTMGPMLSMMVMLTTWSCYEYSYLVMSSSMKILLLFSLLGLGVYGLMGMSWGSNSKYSMLGGNRAIAQTMSYEVCMLTTALVMAYLWFSYSSISMHTVQQGMWGALSMPLLMMIWLLLCLAESNRTPFDTAEGESEIVSGFNIEYGGGLFALIFISEYGMLLMLSFMTTMLFMGGNMMTLKLMTMVFFFIWTRCSFPRVRYDTLMLMSWKILLPYSLTLMVLVLVTFSI